MKLSRLIRSPLGLTVSVMTAFLIAFFGFMPKAAATPATTSYTIGAISVKCGSPVKVSIPLTVTQQVQLTFEIKNAAGTVVVGNFGDFATNDTVVLNPTPATDGAYTLEVSRNNVVEKTVPFNIKCTPASSSPPATTTCVTLTTANVAQYATLTGNRHTSVTVTLKGKVGDYCNNWSFSGVRYNITNPANIWNPPQVVAQVNTASVGKVGLSATATVSDTSCGQNDFYEGTGPAVGDKLPGSGQGYESNHKFLSTIFGGSPTWYQNVSKCATVTPTPTPTVNPPIPAKFYSRTCSAVIVNLYDTNAGGNDLVVKGFIGETALVGVDSAAPDYSALTTFTGVPQGAFTLKVELWLDKKLNTTYTFQVPAATECSTSTPTPTVTPTKPATTPATTAAVATTSTSGRGVAAHTGGDVDTNLVLGVSAIALALGISGLAGIGRLRRRRSA